MSKAQLDAMAELVRKANRSAGLPGSIGTPIEGQIEKILSGDLADDIDVEVPSSDLDTSTEAPDVRVTSDGDTRVTSSGDTRRTSRPSRLLNEDGSARLTEAGDYILLEGEDHAGEFHAEGSSSMSARGRVTRATKLGPAYELEDDDARPLREAIALVQEALDGTVSHEVARPGGNEKVLPLSVEELDALKATVDYAAYTTAGKLWYQHVVDFLKGFKELTDQLTENIESLTELTEASTKLIWAMRGLGLAIGALIVLF
jgi:hypothetical protein